MLPRLRRALWGPFIRYRIGVSKRKKLVDHDRVRTEIQAILDKYPDGNYERTELLLDVRHDLNLMIKRLGISPKTPVKVYLDEGVLVVSFGTFMRN